jgi:hypothetical protein
MVSMTPKKIIGDLAYQCEHGDGGLVSHEIVMFIKGSKIFVTLDF